MHIFSATPCTTSHCTHSTNTLVLVLVFYCCTVQQLLEGKQHDGKGSIFHIHLQPNITHLPEKSVHHMTSSILTPSTWMTFQLKVCFCNLQGQKKRNCVSLFVLYMSLDSAIYLYGNVISDPIFSFYRPDADSNTPELFELALTVWLC